MAAILLGILGANIPTSKLQSTLYRYTGGYRQALGLDQNWALFAPEPRKAVLHWEAVLTYVDGTTSRWRSPEGGRLIGSLWDYRWRKYVEYVTQDGSQELWAPAAAWIARRQSRPGRPVTRVVMVRRFSDLHAPGTKPLRGPEERFEYFRFEVPAQDRGAR